MAPISADNDFLDDALKNKTILPSWRSIFTRLASPNTLSTTAVARITTFLSSKSSLRTLRNCHSSFPPPSKATKQEFEKRTAPINFTAADQLGGDGQGTTSGALPAIADLKTVALNLSKSLNIDEMSALRIVVLEYQGRPAKALLAAEAGAVGDTDLSAGSFGGSFLQSVLRPNQADDKKQKDDKLFYDQVEIYMSERRYVVKVAAALARAALCNPSKTNTWSEVGQQFATELLSKGWTNFAANLVDGIRSRWYEAGEREDGLPGWVKKAMEDPAMRDQVAYSWEKQTFLEIIHLQQLLFLLLYKPAEPVNAILVTKWFGFMSEAKFLDKQGRLNVVFPGSFEIRNFYVYTTGLASVVSLAMIQLPTALADLDEGFNKLLSPGSSATPPAHGPASPVSVLMEKPPYVKDSTAIVAVTNCMQGCAGYLPSSSLAVAGWVVILLHIQHLVKVHTQWDDGEESAARGPMIVEFYSNLLPKLFPTTVDAGLRHLFGRSSRHMLERVMEALQPSDSASGMAFSLRGEEDGLRMKNTIADLVRKTQKYFEFSEPLIIATFLTHDIEYPNIPSFSKFLEQERGLNTEDNWFGNPVERLLLDEGTVRLITRAKNRFPYEPLPFLRLIKGIATQYGSVVKLLTQLDTYTHLLPHGFKDYDDCGPEESGNILLASNLVLFPPRESGMFEHGSPSATFSSLGGIVIPRGTEGVQISSGGTKQVVAWKYSYNALALFGRILECAATAQAASTELVNTTIVTEIMSLLTVLVASSEEWEAAATREPGHYDVPQVLGEASDMLGRNRDVISIAFNLLDTALNCYTAEEPFFVVGLEFVNSLVHVAPGRVWPYLARSVLLERHGRGGAFSGYLSAVEVTRGSYDFTLTCLSLFESLVEEAIRSSAVQKRPSKALTLSSKVAPPGPSGMGVSGVLQRDILLGFTRVVVDIFESYRSFKYSKDTVQKLQIGTKISKIFTTILYYAYGVDEFSDKENKITSVLIPSAEYLVSIFLSGAANDRPIEPILGAIADGVQTPESSLYLQTLGIWVDQVMHIVKFADVLVRIRLYLAHPPSHLEKRLYAASASIAKLYAADEKYKGHVLELLESLVKSSGSFSEEPPSLLGHLGSGCANHFVTLLSTLDKPYQDEGVELRIWNFISAVVSNKQQGLSILLLRGEALRQGNSAGKTEASKHKSMLSICFDALEDIDRLPVEKALAMLEMISTALNFWTLAMDDLAKHPKILPGLTKHVESYTIEFLPADSNELITEKACKIAVAAHISRILALYIHSRKPSDKDETFFRQLLPKLKFYFEKAVKISGYRSSLHVHLQKNFEEKWSGAKLVQLKKTRLRRTIYGPDAVYDMVLGDKVLGFDPGWAGRPDGYRCEVEQANLNLSLVQTQVDLLSSWELLAVELCSFIKNSPELTDSLVRVVEICLQENIETGLPAPIFAEILSRRAEFAFVVVRKLHQALPDSDLFDRIFIAALKAIQSGSAEFRHALTTAGMDYYRSLLRIIYIALRATAKQEKHTVKFGRLVIDLLDLVVAKGFKDLVQATHQHPESANPQDIALVTGILQAALRIQGINEIHTSLTNHLHDNQTIRAATTLFSWAEQLAGGDDGDPVFGELSILFLLELSSVPVIAEQLALENILELLMSTTLAARIAQGVTSLSSPRFHIIWSRGLLPLALNLLANIGMRYGREIIAFIKFFEPQIRTALEGWQKPAVIVLPAVNEVVGICMLIAVVHRMGGKQELSMVNIDTSVAAENIEYLLTHINYLKSLVAATSDEEEEMLRNDDEGGLVDRVIKGLETVRGLLQEDGED